VSDMRSAFYWYAGISACGLGLALYGRHTQVDAALFMIIVLAWMRNLENEIEDVETTYAKV
jgi:hypothetical protein